MDLIDIKIKNALSKKIEEPYTYELLIKKALYIPNKINFYQIIKTIITIILSLLLGTGTVFAGYTIYNKYIRKEEQVESRGLFDDGSGITTYETDLMANDMIWHDDTRLYHKIITNMEDYSKYKQRVSQFPNMTEDDFKQSFIVVLANENFREPQEKDMHIVDVLCDENTTYVTLKQKENPNYNDETNIWYAVVDISQLRDNIVIEIKHKDIGNENFVNIKNITEDYSIVEARDDGCIIILNDEIEKMEKLDSFIEKSRNGQNTFIRIYNKKENYHKLNELEIIDLQYENGIYYCAKVLLYTDIDLNRRELGKIYDYSLYNIDMRRHNVDNDVYINIYGNKYKEGTSKILIMTLKDK